MDSAISSSVPNGGHDHIIRPRPVKPGNPMVLRAQSNDGILKPPANHEQQASGLSSGRSTPLPPDAPPSAQSISSARKQVRAQQKHRMFPTIDYAARVSHFDPRSEYRDFRGFFVLFWIGLAIMVFTTTLRNIKDTGYPLRHQMWDLMTAKTWQLGLSDGAMVASTALSVPLQQVFRRSRGWLRWANAGIVIHTIFQIAWLILWVNWPFMLSWTWTAQVFFTLHTLALFMKMHSYAYYNGHLSNTEHRLSALDHPENASTAAAIRYPSSSTQLNELDAAAEKQKNDDKEETLAQLREDLALELISPLGQVTYPQNLTMMNYVDYILCPTLCYELEYPRTAGRNWMELFWKTLAVFGCIFLLTITSEEFIVPVLNDAALRLQGISSWSEMGLILAESISELLFPFMVTFLLVFLVIFEYVLGAFAEITCFADRHFYSDWWNSCDWLEFSREWNVPVHHFLRRHVYGASRPYLSRNTATLITFLVSAVGHELVMGCITKKLRGYGFIAQMMQLPIVAFQRSKVVRSRKLFNNVLFWISMILGLAMVQAFYTSLPPSLRTHIASALSTLNTLQRSLLPQKSHPPDTVLEKATFFVTSTPLATVLAVLGPFFILLFSMSGWWPTSGRYSPFAAYARNGPPRVTEDDYSYLAGSPPTHSSPRNESYGFPSSRRSEPDLGPDILILKHKGTTYPLHFPAFSIAESELRVRDLRRTAAKETKCDDPRRVKLLYKGRQLRDDDLTCKHEGLKQNSELMCVVSSDPRASDSDSSASSSAINGSTSGPRVSVEGTILDPSPRRKRKGHRGGRKKRDKSPTRDPAFLSPSNGAPSGPSRSPSPSAQQPTKKPQTPSDHLDAINHTFTTAFLPRVHAYMASPPKEQKEREMEYKKLSEGILAQVIMKLDAVDTEGDQDVRGRRKELVRSTQAWLGELDRVGRR